MAIQGIQSLIRCNDRLTILHPSRINIAGWMTSGSLHNSLYQQVKETCRYYEYCIGSTANGIMEHVFNCRVLGNTSFWRRRIHVSFIRRRFQTCQLDIYQVYRVMCRVFEIPSLCVEVGKFNLKTHKFMCRGWQIQFEDATEGPPSFTASSTYRNYKGMCQANETKL